MQKTIMSVVLTGLLVSVVSGCDKQTETNQPSTINKSSELSKTKKTYSAFMEDSKNFTDNTRCYVKVAQAQQEKAGVESVSTIMTLLSHKTSNKQPDISTNHIDNLIKGAIVRGCNPNEISEGSTPLVHMLIANSHDSLKLLLENGADPMLKNQSTNLKIRSKNLFEISDFFRTHDKSAERAKTDDLVQSYKAQFEK